MVINLPITIADADLPRLVAALKYKYATNGNLTPTNAQLIEFVRQSVMQDFRVAVINYEATLVSPIVPPPLT